MLLKVKTVWSATITILTLLSYTKMVKIAAIRSVFPTKNSPECVYDMRSNLDLARGAYDAPPTPSQLSRETSLPIPQPRK